MVAREWADVGQGVRRMLDEQEIRAVLARYCRGVDRMDRGLVESVYHPDAYEDHVQYRGPAIGLVDWALGEALVPLTWTMHNLSTSIITVEGDVAFSETYAICYHGRPLEADRERLSTVGIRYVDRFERRDGGAWLIADRVVVVEWRRDEEIDACRAQPSQAVHGYRDHRDVIYQRGHAAT